MNIPTDEWDELIRRARQKWPQLSEEELSPVQGNTPGLLRLIEAKTGEPIVAVSAQIDGWLTQSEEVATRVSTAPPDAVAHESDGVSLSGLPAEDDELEN